MLTVQAHKPQIRRPAAHTQLAAINPRDVTVVRSTGRVTDLPSRRSTQPVTFNSAS